mgnify:CR=1 FL=1
MYAAIAWQFLVPFKTFWSKIAFKRSQKPNTLKYHRHRVSFPVVHVYDPTKMSQKDPD